MAAATTDIPGIDPCGGTPQSNSKPLAGSLHANSSFFEMQGLSRGVRQSQLAAELDVLLRARHPEMRVNRTESSMLSRSKKFKDLTELSMTYPPDDSLGVYFAGCALNSAPAMRLFEAGCHRRKVDGILKSPMRLKPERLPCCKNGDTATQTALLGLPKDFVAKSDHP